MLQRKSFSVVERNVVNEVQKNTPGLTRPGVFFWELIICGRGGRCPVPVYSPGWKCQPGRESYGTGYHENDIFLRFFSGSSCLCRRPGQLRAAARRLPGYVFVHQGRCRRDRHGDNARLRPVTRRGRKHR